MFPLLSDVADLPPVHHFGARHDRVILRELVDRSGWVAVEELINLLWCHREDGGPIGAKNVIRVTMRHIRDCLLPGFEIETGYTRGYRLVVEKEVILGQVAKALVA